MNDMVEVLAVTISEAARMLSVSESTIFNLLRSGKLASFRVGSDLRRIRVADIEAFIASCDTRPGTCGGRGVARYRGKRGRA